MNQHKCLIVAMIMILSSIITGICSSAADIDGAISLQSKKGMYQTIGSYGPREEWNKTFGGDKFDYLIGVRQTVDEGFVCAGVKDADSWTEGGKCWLIKTDKNGNLLWERTFGRNGANSAHDIQITSDQGYIIGGVTTSFGSGSRDIWVIRTDANGNEEWNCTFNRNTMDIVYVSLTEINGGYILCGDTYSDVSNDLDAWVVKIDDSGHEQWNSTYGFDRGREYFNSVESTSDGGYVFTGSTQNQIAGRYDAWVVKIDEYGQIQWDKKFGPAYTARDIVQTSDGGFLVIATAMVNGQLDDLASWLVKLDENGTDEWDTVFDRSVGIDFANLNKIIPTLDGAYVLVGTIGKFPLHYLADMWMMKIDPEGKILWDFTTGGSCFDSIDGGEITLDGGFIVSGKCTCNNSMNWDARLIKMSSDQGENQPPDKPDKPSGLTSGEINNVYRYITTTNDANGDQLHYQWDWGDGTTSGWLGPYNSGETCEANHTWTAKNNYNIKVKAKDIFGAESPWSDPLPIKMPYSNNKPIPQIYQWLFQRFPHAFLQLRQLLRY